MQGCGAGAYEKYVKDFMQMNVLRRKYKEIDPHPLHTNYDGMPEMILKTTPIANYPHF